jgi:hypothetical protein
VGTGLADGRGSFAAINDQTSSVLENGMKLPDSDDDVWTFPSADSEAYNDSRAIRCKRHHPATPHARRSAHPQEAFLHLRCSSKAGYDIKG